MKQARFLLRSIADVGPSRPSAQKWAGIHRLALEMVPRLTSAITEQESPKVAFDMDAGRL